MGKAFRRHHISMKNAFAGVRWALLTQPNFRVHLFFSAVALIIGWYVSLTPSEWVLLVFTIFWGLSAEMMNTAIESLSDLITREWKKEIKIAKDVAAGMMLTVAIGALVVAYLLLIPKLLGKLP
ncbi:TPA: diacylglycerol kinase [Patescibacteria group bacterium]|uniref:Diacylglycerol kinase n=1 Tax=Candidatus Gottesmanbacteria bacterium GW2011_GWA1_43_11 TaxID=1618436 RepID=A0A0G1CHU5_9BACT|nr:MAG: Diacylglycerol kinase [Candidatus Gottesmanbacteria bacterium GW2011_GWA1_43_11]HCS78528.1 diacylglycerol kinase [Patescibacteria group bacterium]